MTAPPARPHIVPRSSSNFLWSRPSASSLGNPNDWSWNDDLEDDDTWDSASDQEDNGRRKKGYANRIGSGLKVKKTVDADVGTTAPNNASTPSTDATAAGSVPTQTGTSTTAAPIPLTNGRRSANARQASSGGLHASFASHGSPHVHDHQGSTSSGNISFSFTHLDAPSPSSYPSKDPVLPSSMSRPPTATHSISEGDVPSAEEEVETRRAAGWTIVSRDEASANRLARERRERSASGNVPVDGDDGEPVVHINDDDTAPIRHTGDIEAELVLADLELEDRPIGHRRVAVGKEAITLYVEDIVKDPLYRVREAADFRTSRGLSPPAGALPFSSPMGSSLSMTESLSVQEKEKRDRKQEKFEECLLKEDVDIGTLRKLSWSGIPALLRPVVWSLLLGYLPLSSSARMPALARKRAEYQTLVDLTFKKGRDGLDQQIWHQIEIDVPRTRPGTQLWTMEGTQRSLERILYVWAIRHPASGYVQGINDLVTPFYQIFLSAYIDTDPEDFDPSLLPPHVLSAVEADSFWCLSRLLDGIQDNYIAGQPGIHRSVKRMRELVGRIDPALAAHLDAQGVLFMQFAFRWMNCLLMREISVKNTIRMWDAYLSEGTDAFSQFHLYVCSAFLVQWSDRLRQMDFQGIIMFLQSLPTQGWTEHEIEMLLSSAFVLNSTWANAQSHFS